MRYNETWEYHDTRAKLYNAQHGAKYYRENYLALRKLVREYFKGNVPDDELKHRVGYKGG